MNPGVGDGQGGQDGQGAAIHGVAKSRTRLSDFTFTSHFHALEKEMATHSGVLAWRIPGTGDPGGLPSMGSHRVGHDLSDLAAVPQNNRLIRVWMPGSFIDQRWGWVRKQCKKTINLANIS